MRYNIFNLFKGVINDKIKFNAFCSDIGLNASIALNLFIKAVIRNN